MIWLFDIIFLKFSRERKYVSAEKEPVIVEYAKAFFPVLLIVLILRSFIAEPFKIPSASMKPGLIEGDFILVNKFIYGVRVPILGNTLIKINSPKHGDVIVFRHEDHKDLIKRVVGLPGDHITYKNKILSVNNKEVVLIGKKLAKDDSGTLAYKQVEKLGSKEHYIYTYPTQEEKAYPNKDFVVPKDSYFVMGDNRDNSHDSRFWGAVNDKAIIGKAFIIWWSWDVKSWFDFTQFWKIQVRRDRIAKAIE